MAQGVLLTTEKVCPIEHARPTIAQVWRSSEYRFADAFGLTVLP